jgi:microcystin-dependent protein
MTFWKWSRTAATNANADSTINWAEGQAPSSVNDSARAVMAAASKYRDDVAGAITTSGTSTAYTVSSYQLFDTLAHLSGNIIAFTPHVTNGAGGVTLNVDSLGAKPLRSAPSIDLPAGVLVQGTPYLVLYNDSDSAFYLHGFLGDASYAVPIGSGLDYWGASAPSSQFAFAYGQAISRLTYATCFARLGTTYGAGDGSTTFNLPDKRGRASIAKDDMGGSMAGRVTNAGSSIIATSLGATGGAEIVALSQGNLPNVNFAVTGTFAGATNNAFSTLSFVTGAGANGWRNSGPNESVTGAISGTAASGGSGTAVNNMPPAIVCNYIIRIL